jgi:hypothetical protein
MIAGNPDSGLPIFLMFLRRPWKILAVTVPSRQSIVRQLQRSKANRSDQPQHFADIRSLSSATGQNDAMMLAARCISRSRGRVF